MRFSLYKHGSVVLTLGFALSLSVGFAQVAVNTTNNGSTVQSGTYFNTADGKTTFTNTSGGGIWLKTGDNLRGVEVDSIGNLTNNGGTVHFYAPGSVVRLDGNIDIRATRNNQGAFLGNGGNLFVDSAYLYQSGKIYASGINGGLVQFHVGAATFAPGSRIEAKGFGGQGGVISVSGSGSVDIGRQSVFDSSGQVAGNVDANIINIEGGLVNMEGSLQANSVDSRGGTIRIVASGQSDLGQTETALSNAPDVFTAIEATETLNRLTMLKASRDGDILIAGAAPGVSPANISANGARSLTPAEGNDPTDTTAKAGDGGTVILSAMDDINNRGWIFANGGASPVEATEITQGGNGGTISLIASNQLNNTGRVVVDGGAGPQGGDAGLIATSHQSSAFNSGVYRAVGGNSSNGTGGNGGLVVISGASNPTGNGLIVTYGGLGTNGQGSAGTVVTPDPASASNTLMGVWDRAEQYEVASHAENLLFLGRPATSTERVALNLGEFLDRATVRSVRDQRGNGPGQGGQAWSEIVEKSHIPLGGLPNDLQLSLIENSDLSFADNQRPYLFRNAIVTNNQTAPRNGFGVGSGYGNLNSEREYVIPGSGESLAAAFTFQHFNTLTANQAGHDSLGAGLNLEGGGLGGGRLSALSKNGSAGVSFTNDGGVGGGSLLMRNTVGTPGINDTRLNGEIHGGSVIVKSPYRLSIGRNTESGPSVSTNGGLIGGTQQYFSHPREFIELWEPLTANGGLQGGSIYLQGNTALFDYPNTNVQANGGQTNGVINFDGGFNPIIYQPD